MYKANGKNENLIFLATFFKKLFTANCLLYNKIFNNVRTTMRPVDTHRLREEIKFHP